MRADEIEAAASAWLVRMEAGPSDADAAEFTAWRDADPRHAAAYARLAATWLRLDRLRALGVQGSADDAAPAPRPSHRRGVARRIGYAAAAALLLAVGALTLRGVDAGHEAYETDVGGFRRVALADGSVVELNTDTRIRVDLSASRRDIWLERGEANFVVSHDAARPFSVFAGAAAVRATGTQFIVRRLARLEVVVTEGSVAILPAREAAVSTAPVKPALTAGHSAAVTPNGIRVAALSTREVDRVTSWQKGMLLFEDQSVAEIAAEFNRYSERRIVVADPTVAAMRMGGYFRAGNAGEFVDALERNFGVRVERGDREIVLLGSTAPR